MQKVYPKTNTYLKSTVQCMEGNLENRRGIMITYLKARIDRITIFKFKAVI